MKSRTARILFRILLVCLILATFPRELTTALADMAPWGPPNGTNPVPVLDTQVRMTSETVVLDIDANSPASQGFGQITATFILHNLGEKTEVMEVGFPLDQFAHHGVNLCEGSIEFKPINDLAVWVDGIKVQTQKYYREVHFYRNDTHTFLTIPCWEHFTVTFPPNQDVTIRVTYTVEPYHGVYQYEYSYSYVLETGAGWFGTIGSADIIVRMPYELDNYNYIDCWPKPCDVTKYEVQWRFKDYEPTPDSNIQASFLPPPLWQSILVERKNTALNPNDGEAWGRLGKAYKESIIGRRTFRSDPAGKDMYFWSEEAYQKAITLLPNDPDWHYGYAELLCHHSAWDFILTPELSTPAWQACVTQLKQTLDLEPGHEKAKELLKQLVEGFDSNLADLSVSPPDYLILTPQPSATNPLPTKTASRVSITTDLPQRPGGTIEAPVQAITPTIQASPLLPTQKTQDHSPTAPPSQGTVSQLLAGIVIVLALAAMAVLWLRKKQL